MESTTDFALREEYKRVAKLGNSQRSDPLSEGELPCGLLVICSITKPKKAAKVKQGVIQDATFITF